MRLQTVLLVEDDVLIRMATGDFLRDFGLSVIEAESADDALRVLRAQAQEIQVLATDVTMPGSIDGLELANIASHIWPWLGIVIVSGKPRPPPEKLSPQSSFLCKPYDHNILLQEIHSLAAHL